MMCCGTVHLTHVNQRHPNKFNYKEKYLKNF